MNLNLIICLMFVFVQVKCDCDDYFKCVSEVIKDFFGAKDIINKEITIQNTSDFKNKEETKGEVIQNKSISVFEKPLDVEKGLTKILNEATSLIKDEIEGHYAINSEAGPYQAKNNNTEINIHIFNFTKPLNSNIQRADLKSTNTFKDGFKIKVTDHFPLMKDIIDKSVNISESISSNVTSNLFEELLEQQKNFFDSIMNLNNSSNSTYYFNQGGSANLSNPLTRVYLPDIEVNQVVRELIKYHENYDEIIDLPRTEYNQSFIIEEVNDTVLQDLSQFNELVSELIKIHKSNEVTNEQRVQEIYNNTSKNDNHLKRQNIESFVKVNVEKANVSIVTLGNNFNESSKILNNTVQNRKYLPINSEQVLKVKNTTDTKGDKKYLPRKIFTNYTNTTEKNLTNNNKTNSNNFTKYNTSDLNGTLQNRSKQQVTKEYTTIKNMQGVNESRKYLPVETNMNQKVTPGKNKSVINKKRNNSNGDSQKFNETLQSRKYLPVKLKEETDKKQNKTNVTKTTEKVVLKTTSTVNNSTQKSKTIENDLSNNKYSPKTLEPKINRNSKVNITNHKSNPITKDSAKNDSSSVEIDTIKVMNNTNKQEPTANDAIKDNEILTEDFEGYSDYDDEENSTDYPVIDYIELYKDTTNEKVDYVPTTPPDFRSDTDDVKDNKEGEYNGLDGASLSESIFPWIATIFVKNGSSNQFDYYCDGAILSKNTILTSARCVSATNSSKTEDFITIVGKRSLQINGGDETVHRVKQIIPSDNFTTSGNETNNDLAILVLDDHMVFNNGTRATCISSDEETDEAFTTGWGYSGNLTAIRLQKDMNCKDIPQNMLCTAFGNNVAVCPSHGGIHATKHADGQFCLTGIRSSDITARGLCVDRNVIYTDIRDYKDWIEKVVNDNKDL